MQSHNGHNPMRWVFYSQITDQDKKHRETESLVQSHPVRRIESGDHISPRLVLPRGSCSMPQHLAQTRSAVNFR